MKQLRKATIEAIEQTQVLLDELARHETGQSLYTEAGLGKHVRHIIDHFRVFRDGLASNCIDYNKRNRESEMERNMFVACQALAEFKRWIESTDQLDNDRPISIFSEVSCQKTINAKINSNVMRELHYIAYHSIHHLAYCALMASQHGIKLETEIGIAPGTATYLRAVNT